MEISQTTQDAGAPLTHGGGARPVLALRSAAAVLVFLAGTGCQRPKREIDLITTTTGVPLWDEVHTGALAASRHCGLGIHYDGPPREEDLRGQLELFTRSLHKEPAGIIIAPTEAQAFRSPVTQAVSRGLHVVVVDADLGIRDPHLTYVMTDEAAAGAMAAEETGRLLRGRGKVLLTGVDLGRGSSLERERSFETTLGRSFPAIAVVGRIPAAASLVQEQEALEEWLNEGQVPGAIVALSSLATRAAYFAVMSEARAVRPRLVGFDQFLMEPVRSGEIDALVAARAHTLGSTAAAAVCDQIAGHAAAATLLVPPMLVTATDIDSPAIAKETNRSWWKQ